MNYGKTLAKAASTIKDVDTIITGHSPLMKPADLKEYADFNNEFASWIQGSDEGRQDGRSSGLRSTRSRQSTPAIRSTRFWAA